VRSAASAVNLTLMGGAAARSWSAPTATNPGLMDGCYCGFGVIKSTHKATVRPAGLRKGSTG
jgi:hypothetical protein